GRGDGGGGGGGAGAAAAGTAEVVCGLGVCGLVETGDLVVLARPEPDGLLDQEGEDERHHEGVAHDREGTDGLRDELVPAADPVDGVEAHHQGADHTGHGVDADDVERVVVAEL